MKIVQSALLLVFVSLVWTGTRQWVFPPEPAPPVTDRPIETRDRGYVSSRECAACHPGEHASWERSYHRTMTQVASPEAVVAPFDGVELEWRGETWHLSRRGDEFWVRREGGAAGPVEERIVMTTGSHHFQCYWIASGKSRRIDQIPFCWQIAEKRWIEFFAIVLVDPDIAARPKSIESPWNDSCVRCHSVSPRPGVRGPADMDTHVAEFGIACEACHGPGEEHVRSHGDPARRYAEHFSDEPDPTIVNPARLSQKRSTEVCGQCHSVSGFRNADWYEKGSTYRPGDDLGEFLGLIHQDRVGPLNPATRFWPDGMIRPNGREYNSLLRSPCWKGGKLTCLSCHSMHQDVSDERPWTQWADDQLLPGRESNGGCTQCHRELSDPNRLVEHTHHEAGSPGSECYNCHMPNTAFGLQKATRSHEITNPSVYESTEIGRPNACNLCHLDQTLAWTSRHLADWYAIPPVPLEREESLFAASVLWALRGDAVQRVLAAWSMGWEPAQRASGEDWLGLYLGHLLDDPYAAVRQVAFRGLRSLEGFEEFEYDGFADSEERRRARQSAVEIWSGLPDRPSPRTALLIAGDGKPHRSLMRHVEKTRDDRPILLVE